MCILLEGFIVLSLAVLAAGRPEDAVVVAAEPVLPAAMFAYDGRGFGCVGGENQDAEPG